mmetsp:Transcript_65520/g.131800  ORF Transcript_65520/g.131800 Transcript_65520/m.131800 type:complete len:206 (+) Transcript_65520:930-1547(+)
MVGCRGAPAAMNHTSTKSLHPHALFPHDRKKKWATFPPGPPPPCVLWLPPETSALRLAGVLSPSTPPPPPRPLLLLLLLEDEEVSVGNVGVGVSRISFQRPSSPSSMRHPQSHHTPPNASSRAKRTKSAWCCRTPMEKKRFGRLSLPMNRSALFSWPSTRFSTRTSHASPTRPWVPLLVAVAAVAAAGTSSGDPRRSRQDLTHMA